MHIRGTCVPQTHRDPTMTTIKCTCPTCGEVEATENDGFMILLPHAGAHEGRYSFICPGRSGTTCGAVVTKPADGEVIKLLLSARVQTIVLPPEGDEREKTVEEAGTMTGALGEIERLSEEEFSRRVMEELG